MRSPFYASACVFAYLPAYLWSSISNLNQFIKFHESWYERYALEITRICIRWLIYARAVGTTNSVNTWTCKVGATLTR
jgi:hypothetical protein